MMSKMHEILEALHIIPREPTHPTPDEKLRAAVERRTRELEARLRMNDTEIRNLQRKE